MEDQGICRIEELQYKKDSLLLYESIVSLFVMVYVIVALFCGVHILWVYVLSGVCLASWINGRTKTSEFDALKQHKKIQKKQNKVLLKG